MQRNNQNQPRHTPDATQAMAGQPRKNDEDDEFQQPENASSFLTAKELQLPEPAKGSARPARDPFEAEEKAERKGNRG